MTDSDRLTLIKRVDDLTPTLGRLQAMKQAGVPAKQYYEWKHRLGLMGINLETVRTEDLVGELMLRGTNVLIALETVKEGNYIIKVKSEKSVFTTLIMLLDLQLDKYLIGEKKNDYNREPSQRAGQDRGSPSSKGDGNSTTASPKEMDPE